VTERRHHAPNEPVRTLYLAKESGKGQLETTRDDFQIAGGDVSFSVLHIRQITSIQPEFLCNLNLRPAALLSELSQSPPNPDADVIGHNLSSWLEDSAPQTGYKQHLARGCSGRGLAGRMGMGSRGGLDAQCDALPALEPIPWTQGRKGRIMLFGSGAVPSEARYCKGAKRDITAC